MHTRTSSRSPRRASRSLIASPRLAGSSAVSASACPRTRSRTSCARSGSTRTSRGCSAGRRARSASPKRRLSYSRRAVLLSARMSTRAGALRRSVGFYGLMFVSLGSIIGSGWLLGALNAAQVAGPASVLSWLLTAGMLALLALVYAELGAAYPVAGGAGRFPYYCHGPIAGFTAGWASWLQAVFIPPIEVLACITYVNSVHWVNTHFNMLDANALLNHTGLVVGLVLMVVFTGINLVGAKFLSDSNIIVVVWKTVIPFLAIAVVAGMQFNASNFHAGGGFMPFGLHGVFAALPGGVVFALQGFEQAVQLAGEARDPKRDLSRAIITARSEERRGGTDGV